MSCEAAGGLLESGAADIGLTLSPRQIALLERHLSLIAAWSGRLRLTGARTQREAAEVLVLRGLPLLHYVPDEGAIVDLGSGAGVPGVAVAVTRPRARVVLVEASRKKAGFLELVVRDLALSNVEVLHERAETLGRTPEHREQYDAVTARGVAPLRVLVEYALPLLRIGGVAVFLKGEGATDEIAAASNALGVLGGEAELHPEPSSRMSPVVVVRKVAPTSPEYPRRPGSPDRRPL